MNTPTTARYLTIPVLLFCLQIPPSLAMGDNSTESKTPDCPSGQVYDSVTRKCVPDKTSSLSDQDKTHYAYHLAKKGVPGCTESAGYAKKREYGRSLELSGLRHS
jgi:hypothetical protein